MGIAPSGDQFDITQDDLHATIVQVGGGLRSLTVGEDSIIDGYSEREMCHDGRGQILMPWPNRLAGGRYSFDGSENQLPLTEVEHGNAIHGLVRWTNWDTSERNENSVTMTHRLYPSSGYPFTLDLAATYVLSNAGLTVTLRASNIGDKRCPFGAGQHPYVTVGTTFVNTAVLTIPASTMYQYDDHLIPVRRIPVEGTPLDFRESRAIGETAINMDYTDLQRGTDGVARVVLQAPESGRIVEVWMDEAFKHATVYTGETVHAVQRRRTGLAIEPMTCPPNAFVSGEDLVVLEPGNTWTGTWGITIHR